MITHKCDIIIIRIVTQSAQHRVLNMRRKTVHSGKAQQHIGNLISYFEFSGANPVIRVHTSSDVYLSGKSTSLATQLRNNHKPFTLHSNGNGTEPSRKQRHTNSDKLPGERGDRVAVVPPVSRHSQSAICCRSFFLSFANGYS